MPNEKTIDRVAVGLAELAITARENVLRLSPSLARQPFPLILLCLQIDIPEPIPAWAERALQDHHGEPAELVATLRELRDTHKIAGVLRPIIDAMLGENE